jgi:hypothetical protein
MVVNKKELTWDRITKRGFEGPSIFLMCYQEGETLNHLLRSCSISSTLWDRGDMLFQTLDRTKHDINKTIEDWRVEPYQIKFSIEYGPCS